MALTGQIVMGQAIMVKSSEVRPATCPPQLPLSAYAKQPLGCNCSPACKVIPPCCIAMVASERA